MCVIFVCEDTRPSTEMVARAWGHNPEGGGVAWIEGKGVKAEVHWKKGLDEAEMQDFCKTLPLPYIAHFRIASVGSGHPTLCHPFPCTPDTSTSLAGKIKGAVMFHNGTWAQWRDWSLKTSIAANLPIPEGLWNDSRAMAWLAGIYGPNVLEFINEKAAIITPAGTECFGTGWDSEKGVFISNRHFLHSSKGFQNLNGTNSGTTSDHDKVIDIKVTDRRHTASPGGVLATDVPFRGSNQTLLPGGDVQEPVQKGTKELPPHYGEDTTAESTKVTEVVSSITNQPLERARERLRQQRLVDPRLVALADTPVDNSALWKTPQEAAAEAKREREKRLDAARKGITFIGEM